MELIKSANLALRFLLELCLLAALGYWGFKTEGGWLVKSVLGVGAPVLAAVVWGMFVAPKATWLLAEPWLLLLELVLFSLGGAALYLAGQPVLAWLLGLSYIFNKILLYLWQQ